MSKAEQEALARIVNTVANAVKRPLELRDDDELTALEDATRHDGMAHSDTHKPD